MKSSDPVVPVVETVALERVGRESYGLSLKASPHDRKLLRSLGRSLARVGKALDGFSSPLLRRTFKWDLSQALRIETERDAIPEGPGRDSIRRVVEAFRMVDEAGADRLLEPLGRALFEDAARA